MMKFSYRSRPSCRLTRQDLRSIAMQTWSRNNRCGISGYLAFEGATFRQILVGPDDAVARIAAVIIADPRHEAIEILDFGPTDERLAGEFRLVGFDGMPFLEPA
jgi:hypothetical protein